LNPPPGPESWALAPNAKTSDAEKIKEYRFALFIISSGQYGDWRVV